MAEEGCVEFYMLCSCRYVLLRLVNMKTLAEFFCLFCCLLLIREHCLIRRPSIRIMGKIARIPFFVRDPLIRRSCFLIELTGKCLIENGTSWLVFYYIKY